jgi:hypothetical protein
MERPPLNETVTDNVSSTSDHLHCNLVILLFLESHWETDLKLLSEVSVRILKTDGFYRKSKFHFRVSAKSRFNFREFFCSSLLKTQPLPDTVKTMEICSFWKHIVEERNLISLKRVGTLYPRKSSRV